MSNQYHRLLDARELQANLIQDRETVLDAGGHRVLEFQIRVLAAGTAGKIKIQHAAVNEAEAFTDLDTIELNLSSLANSHQSANNFLRYIRWITDSGVGGNPVALIDMVCKN